MSARVKGWAPEDSLHPGYRLTNSATHMQGLMTPSAESSE